MSPFAAALHNQVFVMFCYIDIRNGGLIKALLLIQEKPKPILWWLHPALLPPYCCLHRIADIISDHLSEAVFAEIENVSLECPDCLQLCRGFHPRLPGSAILFCLYSASHRQ